MASNLNGGASHFHQIQPLNEAYKADLLSVKAALKWQILGLKSDLKEAMRPELIREQIANYESQVAQINEELKRRRQVGKS